MRKTNCFLYSVWYCLNNRTAKLKAEWCDDLGWYHFYCLHNGKEIHCEQLYEDDEWTFLFEYKIRTIKARKKNR